MDTDERKAARKRLEQNYNDYSDIEDAMADVRAALDELDAKDAEIERLEQQAVRWEAMYEGMMAERDGLTEDVEQAREALAGLQADGLTRLGVAEGAKPSNMRMGQVREIRWWLERVRALREGGENA